MCKSCLVQVQKSRCCKSYFVIFIGLNGVICSLEFSLKCCWHLFVPWLNEKREQVIETDRFALSINPIQMGRCTCIGYTLLPSSLKKLLNITIETLSLNRCSLLFNFSLKLWEIQSVNSRKLASQQRNLSFRAIRSPYQID